MGLVVVVSGLPATGKTTLARALANDLRLPLVSKDDLKEILFDHLGGNESIGTQKLGAASIALLYHLLETNLKSGLSTIVESNFRPDLDGPKLRALAETHAATLVQVHCRCDGDVLLNRFLARIGSPERHPGHGENPKAARSYLSEGPSNLLDLPGETITVDTTDFGKVDEVEILERLRKMKFYWLTKSNLRAIDG